MFGVGHVPTSGRHQAAIRRTVNRILLMKSTLRRAGDGNRTRTISLGICTVRAVEWSDLRDRLSASDRERPFVTGVNGSLMARPPGPVGSDLGCLLLPVLSIAAMRQAAGHRWRCARPMSQDRLRLPFVVYGLAAAGGPWWLCPGQCP